MTTGIAVFTLPDWLVALWRDEGRSLAVKLVGLRVAIEYESVGLLGCCVPEVERPIMVDFELDGENEP